MIAICRFGLVILATLAVVAARPAWAVVEVLTPLAKFIEDADEIVVARVQKLLPERPAAILKVDADLKGKSAHRELAVNLKGKKAEQSQQLVDRLSEELPLILFVTHLPNQDLAYCYTNGTWFQIIGHRDGQQIRWAFTDLEIYLPRTFNGSTDELRSTLADAIAGKRKPPAANPKVKPGIGAAIDRPAGDKPPGDKPAGQPVGQ